MALVLVVMVVFRRQAWWRMAAMVPIALPFFELESCAITHFTRWTGVYLVAADAGWLAHVGRCYKAEGRESELVDAIRASAGAVRSPWAYLQRCVVNRGDAWTVTPELLGEVLEWAGKKSLEYALTAIGGGYVKRPLPYLRRTLQCAVPGGNRSFGSRKQWVAIAVRMARHLARELEIVGADEAIAAEEAGQRTGFVESVRRRVGRLAFEPEPVRETAVELEASNGRSCRIGLKGSGGDNFNSKNLESKKSESSPGSVKADATLAACSELEFERTDTEAISLLGFRLTPDVISCRIAVSRNEQTPSLRRTFGHSRPVLAATENIQLTD